MSNHSPKNPLPINFEDVHSASERILGKATRTPLITSSLLNEICNANVFIKPEGLQRTGSFKFRGACNAISLLNEDERANGVLAVSSGNHAQGVAANAALVDIPATIIMPSDAPVAKIEGTKKLGAEVILYDRLKEDREALAIERAAKSKASLIHPFNNPHVIAGQGTAGLELCEDVIAQGAALDHMLVCTGGGGLTAGCAIAVRHFFPDAVTHSCEPEEFDDYRRSLISGKLETNKTAGGSICDAVVTPTPGKLSFEINSQLLGEGYGVSDEEALAAVAFAFHHLKLVVEPGGAVALAALLRYKERFSGSNIGVILSGANIDPEVMARALGTC